MTNDRAKVIDRIKKLLAMTGNAGASEAEAAFAAERAQEMIAEHNIAQAELGATGADKIGMAYGLVTNSRPWRRTIAIPLAELYFCKYAFAYQRDWGKSSGKDTHIFCGTTDNTTVANMMFTYLCLTVDRLASKGLRSVPTHQRKGYKTSFKAACAYRLATRLYDKRKKSEEAPTVTQTGTTLPALASLYKRQLAKVEDYMADKTKPARKSSSKPTNARGYHDGRAAGDTIELDQQVGPSKRKALS